MPLVVVQQRSFGGCSFAAPAFRHRFIFEPPSPFTSFDHLVGAGEQCWRHFEAERLAARRFGLGALCNLARRVRPSFLTIRADALVWPRIWGQLALHRVFFEGALSVPMHRASSVLANPEAQSS